MCFVFKSIKENKLLNNLKLGIKRVLKLVWQNSLEILVYKKVFLSFSFSAQPSFGLLSPWLPPPRAPSQPWAEALLPRAAAGPAPRPISCPSRLSRCLAGPACQPAPEPLVPRPHASAGRGHPLPPNRAEEPRHRPISRSSARNEVPRPIKARNPVHRPPAEP